MLESTFFKLIHKYSNDENLINELWNEIEENYSKKNRHYHTLEHLENLLIQLSKIKDKIQDWNCILFTLFYHDIIYKATKSDNEQKSADFAEEKMLQLSIPKTLIEKCKNQIMATKTHLLNQNSDTNYFTDADLSVLGQDWNSYQDYFKNVRKEYSIYPDLLYNPGRRKVLNHFLAMEKIYKTDYFSQKFESNAKLNLQKELEFL